MKMSKMAALIGAALAILVTFGIFQNCAKGKFVDPDLRHSAIAMGYCQNCADASGQGLACRADQAAPFGACLHESCSSGHRMDTSTRQCVPVVCTAGQVANCEVPHGEGRRTCRPNGVGYTSCTAIACFEGFDLINGQCVPRSSGPTQICVPATHRDCGTTSTEGLETCNGTGTAYDACVMGDCKAGFNKDAGTECVANICDPEQFTPCDEGAGSGFKKCNSQGSGFGTCEISACADGYTLKDGVCVVHACVPGAEAACDFDNGSGVKVCATDGLDFGACTLIGCDPGYYLDGGACIQNVCNPGDQIACQENSGSGKKVCHGNGRGYGSCLITACDPGFKIRGGQCVTSDSCVAGETEVCAQQNGTGIRECNTSSGKFNGNCELTACNAGYTLQNPGNSASCKKDK